MEKIDHAISEIREMDELAAMSSPVHKLHPTAKLVATAVYILFVVSFGKYNVGSLFVLVLYPILMFACSGISGNARRIAETSPISCTISPSAPRSEAMRA